MRRLRFQQKPGGHGRGLTPYPVALRGLAGPHLGLVELAQGTLSGRGLGRREGGGSAQCRVVPFQALEKKGISHLEEKELKERNKRIQEDNRLELQKVGVPSVQGRGPVQGWGPSPVRS